MGDDAREVVVRPSRDRRRTSSGLQRGRCRRSARARAMPRAVARAFAAGWLQERDGDGSGRRNLSRREGREEGGLDVTVRVRPRLRCDQFGLVPIAGRVGRGVLVRACVRVVVGRRAGEFSIVGRRVAGVPPDRPVNVVGFAVLVAVHDDRRQGKDRGHARKRDEEGAEAAKPAGAGRVHSGTAPAKRARAGASTPVFHCKSLRWRRRALACPLRDSVSVFSSGRLYSPSIPARRAAGGTLRTTAPGRGVSTVASFKGEPG